VRGLVDHLRESIQTVLRVPPRREELAQNPLDLALPAGELGVAGEYFLEPGWVDAGAAAERRICSISFRRVRHTAGV
jgi:hypothetical protein